MKYNFTYESENAEQDLAQVVDILMNALERGVKIYKDAKSAGNEAQALDTFSKLNENVANLGSKLDNLNFKEVDTTKTSSSTTKK